MFGAAVVTLLVLSLVHYDVLFKKSLLVCFYLGLGLIRRHARPAPAKAGGLST
jgi:hypothetical protein